ncbi:hypothetical protein D7X98_10550 [bacterium 1XD8-76]|nr:hypothetical protein D7X98_10550 [bacterium 1XD8-76]
MRIARSAVSAGITKSFYKIIYIFIPLDIFRESQQNKSIKKKLDAWLTLLSFDEPEKIIALIEKYPEFRKIYEEGCEICRNTERVMEMFSKELYELDKNTVQYMIDEMQDTIDAQKETLGKQRTEIDAQKEMINKMEQEKEKILKENEEAQRKNLAQMQMERENAIIGTINLLRTMNVPEEEIIRQVCGLYRIGEEQAEKYFDDGDLASDK